MRNATQNAFVIAYLNRKREHTEDQHRVFKRAGLRSCETSDCTERTIYMPLFRHFYTDDKKFRH